MSLKLSLRDNLKVVRDDIPDIVDVFLDVFLAVLLNIVLNGPPVV